MHCLTEKGRGYQPALAGRGRPLPRRRQDPPATPACRSSAAGADWTSVFGEEMVELGEEREDIVAITAAMLQPVGLDKFAEALPRPGLRRRHRRAARARSPRPGLATGGLHPVFAVYATFLNRAFDQVLMDVALHKCGVTFVLDRAGVTGTDGASHNGMWDMSILQVVPGLRIAAPRDADQVRAQLREAVEVDDAPTVVRFPKGAVGPPSPAVGAVGGMDVLRSAAHGPARRAAGLRRRAGADVPGDRRPARRAGHLCHRRRPALGQARRRTSSRRSPTSTACGRRRGQQPRGGVGSAVAQALRDAGVDVPLRTSASPSSSSPHAKRGEVLADIGLTPAEIAGRISAAWPPGTRRDGRPVEASRPRRNGA